MSSPSSQQNLRLKRKKPPTFQHLPAQRAKKLKRSWVEVQKIKSKWKAQKRKEGLVASRHQSERRAHEPNNRGSGEDPEDEENERASGSSDGSLGGAASEKNGDEVESEESSEDEGPGTPHAHAKSASSKRPNPPKNARNRPQESSSTEEPRLLEAGVGGADTTSGEEEEAEVVNPGVGVGFNEAVTVANRIWVFV
ncbi:hypothetical protein GSI_13797 [Ganoderma sinense ZZ0214-1]|uniref:Uncharacterized protein n=1 Tax=Ganoderma sinense ZZ0214-1 TaxID=1077348 RepID=A0A2G8RRA6_9APHY|nr:hypothetical protein GSI_13797 [Ganoderma sinense ZZ0214-1]